MILGITIFVWLVSIWGAILLLAMIFTSVITNRRVLSRWFPIEEINGRGLCPTYLYRWTLFQPTWGKGFGIYVHNFVGDDWSLDFHDHPKRFISIGLKGSYFEHMPGQTPRLYFAPWVRTFPAEHTHRLTLPRYIDDDGEIKSRPAWTLVIVLTHVREWGFHHDGTWIPWRQYVKSDVAKERKACP